MKLLINIDQRASLAAGFEAPQSTTVIDIPIKSFPDTMRTAVAENYDPRTKRLSFDGKQVSIPNPVNEVKVLAAIKQLYQEWLADGPQQKE